MRAAIQTSADRSQTFRTLVVRANAAAGIVYVEPVEHTRHDPYAPFTSRVATEIDPRQSSSFLEQRWPVQHDGHGAVGVLLRYRQQELVSG